ncbi:MAG: DUF5838 family protein [Gammaproteobacteria bacterium]|nr:DUF5838 family protein [Gammaproteobacteria bacterium]
MRVEGIIKYYNFKEMFNIGSSVPLKVFEDFLLGNVNWTNLECSNNYNNGTVFSQRFNLWFYSTKNRQNIKKNISDILSFFDQMESSCSIKFDYSLLNYVLRRFDFDEIYSVTCGVDFRPCLEESKMKIWFITKKHTKKIFDIIMIHGAFDETMELCKAVKPISNTLNLFGLELSFSGTTRFKIYPYFSQKKFAILKDFFHAQTFSLIKKCRWIWITFDKELNKIIHFAPKNIDKFLKLASIKKISLINQKYKCYGYKIFIISFLEKEIQRKNFKKINLYCFDC